MRRWASWLCVSLLVLGCPERKEGTTTGQTTAEKLPPCAEFGQRCEFSPGKFGSCVQRDDCPLGQKCFVCQSQH